LTFIRKNAAFAVGEDVGGSGRFELGHLLLDLRVGTGHAAPLSSTAWNEPTIIGTASAGTTLSAIPSDRLLHQPYA
jgi:hypothetical protein